MTEQLHRMIEQDELKFKKSECAISLSLLEKDNMSVRGWLRRCSRLGHTRMQDLIYAYHGLKQLLQEYKTKRKHLEHADTDPEHVWLMASFPMRLVCCL